MKDKKMDNINLQSSLDLESFEGVRNLNESFDGIEEISAKKVLIEQNKMIILLNLKLKKNQNIK